MKKKNAKAEMEVYVQAWEKSGKFKLLTTTVGYADN